MSDKRFMRSMRVKNYDILSKSSFNDNESSQTYQMVPISKGIRHETSQKSSMADDKNIYLSSIVNKQVQKQFFSFNSRNLAQQSPGNSNNTNLFSNISNINLSKSFQKLDSLQEKLKQSKSNDDDLSLSLKLYENDDQNQWKIITNDTEIGCGNTNEIRI